MKTIRYKATGEALLTGANGGLKSQPIATIVEVPYSESNLKAAEENALSGTIEVLDAPESEIPPDNSDDVHRKQIVFVDRATGKPYSVYVENGKLMMEVV